MTKIKTITVFNFFYWLIFFILLMIFIPAKAARAEGPSLTILCGPEHTPNSNYGDGIEADSRFEVPIYKDLSGAVESSFHGPMDHYGYGDLSGYSGIGEVVYRPKVAFFIKPYVLAGAGWFWSDFDRNQDMKDKGIIIKTGDAFCQKYAVGLEYPVNENFSIVAEWSYFQSDVPKESYYESSGLFANVAGGNTIGEGETNVTIGGRFKF